MKVKIVGTGSAVPEKCVTNDDLSQWMDTSDEWIRSRTGIETRHLAVRETTTEMAVEAAKRALASAHMDAEGLELIIAATITPDRLLPNLACEVQSALGACRAVAFDVSAACSGFLYAMDIARHYLEAGGSRRALVIGAETLSRIMDWSDRSTCVLFGDGAGAAVLEADEAEEHAGILSTVLGTDGAGGMVLRCDNRRNHNPYVKGDTALSYVSMNGQEVYKFAVRTVPFNTAYKYSAKDFGAQGCYVVGAPDILAGTRAGELTGALSPLLAQGRRVLLLAKYNAALPDPPAALDAAQLEFLALLPLQNRIRENAPKTFRFFARQGVDVKVISGDDPQAVSHVAADAGIAGAEHWVDAATLRSEQALAEAAEKCTVFGRVTPEQKRQLVHALQKRGHTVAMTGDGVNDVLALKDADCGIAIASGAQAASQVAQLVLLDSDFAALPSVVAEGRRVINNIQRSASLFLVKNIFSFLLSIVALGLPLAYPFQPLQLSLVTFATIGAPAFFLALEPNHELVRGKFMRNVMRAAMPGGLTDFLLVFCAQGFGFAFGIPSEMVGTICTLAILCVGLQILWGVCIPFTPLHWAIWGSMAAAGIGGALLLAPWLPLVRLNLGGVLVLIVLLALSAPTLAGLTFLGERLHGIYNDLKNKHARKQA